MFKQGDPGFKFYIVLQGFCSVLGRTNMQTYGELVRYGAGDSFGELALLRNSHRTASVICNTDCHFAVLNRDEFSRIIGKVKEELLELKVNFLARFPFFRVYSKGEMQRLSYYFKEQTYKRKQYVFSIGDPCSSLYFIKEGEFQVLESVEMTASSPLFRSSKARNRLVEFTILTKNQLFGEEEEESVRKYAVVCHSALGVLLVISRQVSGN